MSAQQVFVCSEQVYVYKVVFMSICSELTVQLSVDLCCLPLLSFSMVKFGCLQRILMRCLLFELIHVDVCLDEKFRVCPDYCPVLVSFGYNESWSLLTCINDRIKN